MKIISLNTWGGRAGQENLLSFFKEHQKDTDIFCLQEVWSAPYKYLEGHTAGGREISHLEIMTDGFQKISSLLSDFTPFFRPHHGDHYGLLMMVKNSIEIDSEGEVFVYKHKWYVPKGDVGNHARNIQYVKINIEGMPVTVVNFHGLWNGNGKGDSDDRLIQSEKIKKFISEQDGEVVLCGDFNLLPNTKSIKILEDFGLKNLISENNIKSTRTSFYTKPEKFADYVFVSKNIKVKKFNVLPDEVSDHNPLFLEFSL